MKKWISAVIAFAMLLSLSCPVFAERLLKPIEEAAPAAVEVEDETPVIPEELVPTAAAPTVALTAAEYELGYVNMATELSAALGGALKGYDYRDKRTFGKIGDEPGPALRAGFGRRPRRVPGGPQALRRGRGKDRRLLRQLHRDDPLPLQGQLR